MQTTHRLLLGDARDLSAIAPGSVQLVVTSPPYPMVEMWDEAFAALDPAVPGLLAAGQGMAAFAAMHAALDPVWAGCARALCDGGLLCVNIGDATRSLAGEFCLYPNHVRLSAALMALGLTPLPDVLWRKPTNAPNKFMGSGMLPAGAYVTYEHEYIVIFRKGRDRKHQAPRGPTPSPIRPQVRARPTSLRRAPPRPRAAPTRRKPRFSQSAPASDTPRAQVSAACAAPSPRRAPVSEHSGSGDRG